MAFDGSMKAALTRLANAIKAKIGSSNGTVKDEIRLTQAQYDALGSGRPATTKYIIIG